MSADKAMPSTNVFDSLRRGQVLAAVVEPTDPNRLAWVGVYPLDLRRATTRELLKNHGQPIPLEDVQAYRIRRFEVDRTLIEEDRSVAEPDLQKNFSCFAFGDDDLAMKLQGLGAQIELLSLPYRSDYPI